MNRQAAKSTMTPANPTQRKDTPLQKQTPIASVEKALLAEIKQLKMQNQFLEASNDRITTYLARVQADRDVFRKESARLLERCSRLEISLENHRKNAKKGKPSISILFKKLSKLLNTKKEIKPLSKRKPLNKVSAGVLQYKLRLMIDKFTQQVSKGHKDLQEKLNNNMQQRRLEKAKTKRQKAKEKQMKFMQHNKKNKVRHTQSLLSDVEKDFFDYKAAQ